MDQGQGVGRGERVSAMDATSPVTPITRDNIHLSEVIPAGSQTLSVADCDRTLLAGCTDPKVLEFIAAATASSTRRAYRSDVAHFVGRGGYIPATAEQVARYLADHAAVLSMATLARRLAGIRAAHVERGFPDPTKGELIRLTFRGIRRRFGRPQCRVAALSSDDLRAMVTSLGQSTKDTRDAAILLIGFGGAFRRSELVAIDCNDVEIRESDAVMVLRRSKTDQDGHGRAVSIPRVPSLLCPVAALEKWLRVSQVKNGPVFRPVTKSGTVKTGRISPEAIACILKNLIQTIGRDPARYSGHSLRAGFATGAARMGVPMWRIRAQTGHLSDSMLERYIREGELSSIDALKMLSVSVAGPLSSALHDTETQQSSPS
jgi:integrase